MEKDSMIVPGLFEEKASRSSFDNDQLIVSGLFPEKNKSVEDPSQNKENKKDFQKYVSNSPLVKGAKEAAMAGAVSPGIVEIQAAPGRLLEQIGSTGPFKIAGATAIPFTQKEDFEDIDKKLGDAFLGYTSPGHEIVKDVMGPLRDLPAYAATQSGPIGSLSSVLEAMGYIKPEKAGESAGAHLLGTQLDLMASPNVLELLSYPLQVRYKLATEIFNEYGKYAKEKGKNTVVDEGEFMRWAEGKSPSELKSKLAELKERIRAEKSVKIDQETGITTQGNPEINPGDGPIKNEPKNTSENIPTEQKSAGGFDPVKRIVSIDEYIDSIKENAKTATNKRDIRISEKQIKLLQKEKAYIEKTGKEYVQTQRKPPTYNLDKAISEGNGESIIKAMGGFSVPEGFGGEIRDLSRGEKAKLNLHFKKEGAQSADELLQELKGMAPQIFDKYQSGIQLVIAAARGELKVPEKIVNDYEKEYDKYLQKEAEKYGADTTEQAEIETELDEEEASNALSQEGGADFNFGENAARSEGDIQTEITTEESRKPVQFGQPRELPAQQENATELQQAKNESDQGKLFEPGAKYGKTAIDKEDNEILDSNGNPIPINRDGTVTLYHRTTKENAEKIKKTGIFISKENTNETFFSNFINGQAEGFGEAVVTVKVRPNRTRLDDAFPSGEVTLAVSNKDLSRSNIVESAQEPSEKYGRTEPFYSAVERSIDKLPNSFSGEQALKTIQNTEGVKQEEIDWMGLKEFLQSKPKITKQELSDFINSHKVEIKEVEKGAVKPEYIYSKTEDGLRIDRTDISISRDEDTGEFVVYDGGEEVTSLETLDKAKEYAEEHADENYNLVAPSETKFHSYTIPGGENYREVLLTLPTDKETDFFKWLEKRIGKERYEKIGSSGANRYRAEFDNQSRGVFKSPHFDEPNIIAHFRLNDRQTDLGKTLFIEEIQSDWHQKGRKEGYRAKELTINKDSASQRFFGRNYADIEQSDKAIVDKYLEEYGGPTVAEAKQVPDAPFKKTWHELALKRVLRMAVEEGYDAIAWTTGEIQNERYDLSKQVRLIEWKEYSRRDATQIVIIEPTNGNTIELPINDKGFVIEGVGTQFDGKRLDDVIGKDLSIKVASEKSGSISGDGLKIGGEGMKGFYDRMIPSFLNKYTKKWGGRVSQATIQTEGQADVPGADRMPHIKKEKVHALEITPSMKKSVMQGQALFEPKQSGFDYGKLEQESEVAYGDKEKAEKAIEEVISELEAKYSAQNIQRAGIVRELRTKKEISYAGHKIDGPDALAQLHQVFRSPAIESFVYYVTDSDGVILSNRVHSSGLVDQSFISNDVFDNMLADLQKAGKGAKLYLAHNHPSGRMLASSEDINLTRNIKRMFPKSYAGHVIIDHGEYVFLDQELNQQIRNYKASPESKNWNAGKLKVRGPDGFSGMFSNVLRGSKYLHIPFLDKSNNIVAYEIFNPARLGNKLTDEIVKAKDRYAASAYVIMADKETMASLRDSAVPSAYPSGLLDNISVHENGYDSGRESGISLKSVQDGNVIFEPNESYGKGQPMQSAPNSKSIKMNPVLPEDKLAKLPKFFGGMEYVKAVQMPELVKLAVKLSGRVPKIKKFRKSLGMFYGINQGLIKLHPEIFKDPQLAGAVLAHEIGHNIDWLPEGTLSRGNLIGRAISSVNKFMKNQFGDMRDKDVFHVKVENGEVVVRVGEKLEQDIKDRLKKFGFTWSKFAYRAPYSPENVALAESIKSELPSTLREELKALTTWWHPFEPIAGDNYTKYRYSSVELYAEFMSVLLNAPAKAKEMAPNFYKAFFKHIGNKPEVAKQFIEIQKLVQGDDRYLNDVRLMDLKEMFGDAEQQSRILHMKRESALESSAQFISRMFIDENYAILKGRDRVARGQEINPEKDPKNLVEGLKYIPSVVRAVLERIDPVHREIMQKGLHFEVDAIMFLDRITGDRKDLGNPRGHNEQTALAALNRLKEIDPVREEDAREIVSKIRDWYKQIAAKANDIYSPEQYASVMASDKYAPFRVIKYMREYVSAGIIKQQGTLDDVGSPYTALLLKTIAMINAIERNAITKQIGEFILSNSREFGRVSPAKVTQIPGRPVQFEHPKEPGMSLVKWRSQGKWIAYHMETPIAEVFDNPDTAFLQRTGKMIATVLGNNIFRAMYVTFQPGFWVPNFFRDFWRYWKNIPDMTIGRALKSYGNAFPASLRRVRGEFDQTVNRMLEEKALTITFTDLIVGQTGEDKEIERIMKRYDILEDKKTYPMLLKPILKLGEALVFVSNIFETVPKVAGYMELENLPMEKRAYIVRNLIGTPNYKRQGKMFPIYNNILMFSNIAKEDMRGAIEVSLKSKEGKRKYWWKTFKLNFAHKLLLAAAAAGLFGQAIKDNVDSMTEYDKTNYVPIPLGEIDGDAMYIRIPQDDYGRLVGGILWKVMSGMDRNTLSELISYTGGQIPFAGQLAPGAQILGAWGEYIQGKNPRDNYHGYNLLSDQQMDAGGMESFAPMVMWTLNQTGYVRFNIHDRVEDKDVWDWALELTPVVNRLIKKTNYGQVEANQKAIDKVRHEEAKKQLDRTRMVKDALRTEKDIEALLENVDSAEEQKKIAAAYNRNKAKYSNDPIAQALTRASSNAQKMAVLERNMARFETEDEFVNYLEYARGLGIVSMPLAREAYARYDSLTKK